MARKIPNCPHCDIPLRHFGDEKLQLGQTGWILGDVPNLLAGSLPVHILYCPECHKLEFFLRDAKVEILYTLESLAPAEFTYNTSSLIFKLELGGQTFLMLADATQDACRIAYSMYGDYLKSDFVQAAHHGFGVGSSVYTGVTSVYSAAAAPVVLWPCSDDAFSTMNDRAASRHLIELDSTKEIFVAGDRTIRLPLPYTAGTSGQESILK